MKPSSRRGQWKMTRARCPVQGLLWRDQPHGAARQAGQPGQMPRARAFLLRGHRLRFKLDFTTKCTDGLRRRFRSLTKAWLSKESLQTSSSETNRTVAATATKQRWMNPGSLSITASSLPRKCSKTWKLCSRHRERHFCLYCLI